MTRRLLVILTFALVTAGPHCASTSAQGLIFSLPEDGTGVVFEGELNQETVRPELEDGREEFTWTRTLSIKSVGREEAEFEGTVQPCRWIEIKVVTGKSGAGGIDSGLVGARIYKFLVPESKVSAAAADADGIPNSVLPIVRGFRRLGEEAVEPIKSKGLVVYPTLCLLPNYQAPEVVTASTIVDSLDKENSFDCRKMQAEFVRERPDARSTNTGSFWVSSEVPFGLAGWEVKVVRESKGATDERLTFTPVGTVICKMQVSEVLDFVESELITGD